MIPFSGLSLFSGHFGGDGPSPLNRDTTVFLFEKHSADIVEVGRKMLPLFLNEVQNEG